MKDKEQAVKQEPVTVLPDGSAFAVMSFPLPVDHWSTVEGDNVPPMPLRLGTGDPRRQRFNEAARAAAKYAIRASTMNGKENDFDPDAMVQNFVVGLLGYHTPDGLCGEEWADPKELPDLLTHPAQSEREAKDTKRLDWLEAHPGFSLEKFITWRNGEGEYDGVERGYWQLTTNDDDEFAGTSIRDAIDAALKQKGEQ